MGNGLMSQVLIFQEVLNSFMREGKKFLSKIVYKYCKLFLWEIELSFLGKNNS